MFRSPTARSGGGNWRAWCMLLRFGGWKWRRWMLWFWNSLWTEKWLLALFLLSSSCFPMDSSGSVSTPWNHFRTRFFYQRFLADQSWFSAWIAASTDGVISECREKSAFRCLISHHRILKFTPFILMKTVFTLMALAVMSISGIQANHTSDLCVCCDCSECVDCSDCAAVECCEFCVCDVL